MSTNTIRIRIKESLGRLSFKSGLMALGICIICYIISFAQALLPISLGWKGALWIIFFGLAKLFQYTGILILGKEGIKKLKEMFKKRIVSSD